MYAVPANASRVDAVSRTSPPTTPSAAAAPAAPSSRRRLSPAGSSWGTRSDPVTVGRPCSSDRRRGAVEQQPEHLRQPPAEGLVVRSSGAETSPRKVRLRPGGPRRSAGAGRARWRPRRRGRRASRMRGCSRDSSGGGAGRWATSRRPARGASSSGPGCRPRSARSRRRRGSRPAGASRAAGDRGSRTASTAAARRRCPMPAAGCRAHARSTTRSSNGRRTLSPEDGPERPGPEERTQHRRDLGVVLSGRPSPAG